MVELQRNDPSSNRCWFVHGSISVVTFIFYLMSLLVIHVNGVNVHSGVDDGSTLAFNSLTTPTFHERLQQGPNGLYLMDLILFGVIIMLGFEIMSYLALHTGEWSSAKRIPVRGKHLDDLTMLDKTLITLNKLTAPPFIYCFLRYSYFAPHVPWKIADLCFQNTFLALPLLFLTYDLFYTLLHGALHIKGIYGWIHKHHHHQKAPSRGNVDAVNVHPIEYFLGEFNHLLALHLVSTYQCQVHVVTAMVFLSLGGYLAGINHTRFDVTLFGGVYDSKAHDVHHRIPQSNYGQYTMFWDKVFGSYRPYNPEDRINPNAQLNLATGKSMDYQSKKIK